MSDSQFEVSVFASIDPVQLSTVNGGDGESWLSRGLGFGNKLVRTVAWPIKAGIAAYDGYEGYAAARAKGAGVGEALGAGAQNAASGATFGLIPPPK